MGLDRISVQARFFIVERHHFPASCYEFDSTRL